MRFFIFCLVLLTSAHTAFAACNNPEGVEGEIIFNRAHKVMQFCDGDKWRGMGGGSSAIGAEAFFSQTNDLSDIQTYWDVSNGAKTVTLVNVTGAGYLLGGEVRGYYPTDMNNNNYRIEIIIDGATPIIWPPGPHSTHFYNAAANNNEAAITLPPIAFLSSLVIRYKTGSTTTRVHGTAIVKQ